MQAAREGAAPPAAATGVAAMVPAGVVAAALPLPLQAAREAAVPPAAATLVAMAMAALARMAGEATPLGVGRGAASATGTSPSLAEAVLGPAALQAAAQPEAEATTEQPSVASQGLLPASLRKMQLLAEASGTLSRLWQQPANARGHFVAACCLSSLGPCRGCGSCDLPRTAMRWAGARRSESPRRGHWRAPVRRTGCRSTSRALDQSNATSLVWAPCGA